MNSKLIYPEESYAIIGACFNVYNEKGCRFLESVYQECLEIEFEHQKIPFVAQKEIRLVYRGRNLRQTFKADFVCFEKILLEIKAVSQIVDEYRAQVLNYLNATGYTLGMLINFGHYPKLEYERIAFTGKQELPRIMRLGANDQWKAVEWKNNSRQFA
jgi:GxxExxY protein